MLDLESDVNNLPRKTWEAFFIIQLCMENQYCILIIRCLEYVEVDIAIVNTYVYFKVIDIMGDKDPYSSLLDIDWTFENYSTIDLKREAITFEADGF